MICLTPRSDQISIARFAGTKSYACHDTGIEEKVKEGCRNVPQPPSPQMVIEILSAIAWPTTMMRGRLGGRLARELYIGHTRKDTG